jgi:hypothetical protein
MRSRCLLGIVLAIAGTAGFVASSLGAGPASKNPVSKKPVAAETQSREALAKACRQTAGQLAEKLGDGCNVVERPPFVLAGNMSASELEEWHRQTIAPAARALASSYFTVAPDKPITVLLFPNEKSYNQYAKQLFGDQGISVYGYYKPTQRTLVMNIGTGGGTLVHELTHALADFDYPAIPDWFNEGLASLHEQCRFREDKEKDEYWIEGLENWRLPILHEAIKEKRLRSLKSLVSDDDFRGGKVGTNYAQARYFCLYLQRKGLLKEFYRQMRRGQQEDRLGIKAVEKIVPAKSWEALDEDFQAWALALKR